MEGDKSHFISLFSAPLVIRFLDLLLMYMSYVALFSFRFALNTLRQNKTKQSGEDESQVSSLET